MSKIMNRYEFSFYPDDESVEQPVQLSFEEPDDGLHCAKFHRMCKAFAYALGYQNETIERYFGEDSWEDVL